MNPDVALRHVERTAVVVCGLMALAAGALGRFDIAAGVIGGGLLSAASYSTIGQGVSALTAMAAAHAPSVNSQAPTSNSQRPQDAPVSRPKIGTWTLLKVVLRYALLGLLAYVMIARLRLHPVGLLAGASSVVAAVSIEAFRLLMKKS